MLTLNEIRKDYGTDADTVHALRGVSLHFRPHEFVAILGPSGCGKTTLLNIIGGLDHYTSGDLIINGTSTKEYKDKDWDTYRNHRVGFIFQSYNLIPHQTVLANVELALTLSGVSKSVRRARATEALGRVGLTDQLKKKPSQMSGGQMQRVAIARALVNDPEIVLADEPTGALDTATSEQIMEILAGISREKLIVMVTHNPDLAERYATRIIRVLDGQVISDSNPYDGVSEETEPEDAAVSPGGAEKAAETAAQAEGRTGAKPGKKRDKTSMSFLTALSLSLNNLLTKKARTFLTAFAGSIGIIGIALVLALSNGINIFIAKVQEDTLSSYPVEISSTSMDLGAMLSAFSGAASEDFTPEDGYIYSNDQLSGLSSALLEGYKENDLVAFRRYIESGESTIKEHATVQYRYGVTPQVYYKTEDKNYLSVSPSEVFETLLTYLGMDAGSVSMTVWDEMIDNQDLLKSQYTVLDGRWPTAYNEVVLVTDKNHQISDLMLYALGLKDKAELQALLAGTAGEVEQKRWTYDELLGLTYRMVLPVDYYVLDSETGTYQDLRKNANGQVRLNNLLDGNKAIDIKVVGIISANPDAAATSINGTVGYTSALTQYIIEKTTEQDADGNYKYPLVGAQLADPETDALTGKPFYEEDLSTNAEKAAKFDAWLSEASDAEIASQYEENLENILFMEMYFSNMAGLDPSWDKEDLITQIKGMMENDPVLFSRLQREVTKATVSSLSVLEPYVASQETFLTILSAEETPKELLQALYPLFAMLYEDRYDRYVEQVRANLSTMETSEKAASYRDYVAMLGTGEASYLSKASLWDIYLRSVSSMSTYKRNCRLLGITDEESPTVVYLYPKSFSDKEAIEEEINAYNAAHPNSEITYTDYIGIMLDSVSIILDVITYVLIAFVSISLVVSSIMIGIITYISVLERIKEIGILRAIGASKRDVSHVFLAETLIIGFTAGIIGILVTLLLSIPINIIIRALSGFQNIGAQLPFLGAVILVLISMALTLIAGLIPAKIAAKKEPVEALRSE